MKLAIVALVVILGVALADPYEGIPLPGSGGGVVHTVTSTLGGAVHTLGGAVNGILGFGDKITNIPWIDIAHYFQVNHGIGRIPNSEYCTCPYVYRGDYSHYSFLNGGINSGPA